MRIGPGAGGREAREGMMSKSESGGGVSRGKGSGAEAMNFGERWSGCHTGRAKGQIQAWVTVQLEPGCESHQPETKRKWHWPRK